MKLLYIFIILYILDIFLTYINARTFKKKFPKADYTKLELNYLIKTCWRKFGLGFGTIFGVAITTIILSFVLFTSDDPEKLFYMLFGAYAVILIQHVNNFISLKKLKEAKTW